MVAHRGDGERRAPLLARAVDVRAALDEQADFRDVGRGDHQGRRSERILRVDVGALVEEVLHCVDRTDRGGVEQRRVALFVLGVRLRSRPDERLHPREIVAADGGVDLVAFGAADRALPSGVRQSPATAKHSARYFAIVPPDSK